MTEPLCLTCQHHNKDCPMDNYPKTCVEHKPETVADLYEEISALRKDRDQLSAALAAEREKNTYRHCTCDDHIDSPCPVHKREVDLQNERDAARAEAALSKQETHAVEHMLVRRLGGTVEGAPTSTVNYLQRVDELREIERVSDALRARVTELEKSAHESSGQEGKLAHMLNQAHGRVAELDGELAAALLAMRNVSAVVFDGIATREQPYRVYETIRAHLNPVLRKHAPQGGIDAALAGGEVPHGK